MLCPKIWSLAIWSLEILIALSDVELFADYESVIKKFEIACKHLQIAVFLAPGLSSLQGKSVEFRDIGDEVPT